MAGNIDKISSPVYVHDPKNPPEIGRGVDVKIKLVNSKHLSIENGREGEKFILNITDPSAIGLSSFQSHDVERFVNDLILSCNLVLKKAAFSKNSSDPTHSTIERKNKPAPKPKAEDTPSGKKVTVSSGLSFRFIVHITIGFEDELDETKALELLSKILALKNGTVPPTLKVNNIQKSLDEFQSAMSILDGLGIFKQLFSSLETSTNCDGIDRTGQKLVKEASRLSGVADFKIEDCRSFNGRAKHIDRTPKQENEYQEGLKKLDKKINYVREAAQKIITRRLKSVT